jgi:hypothetical protein
MCPFLALQNARRTLRSPTLSFEPVLWMHTKRNGGVDAFCCDAPTAPGAAMSAKHGTIAGIANASTRRQRPPFNLDRVVPHSFWCCSP